jgi:hypothetical protein
MKEYNKCQLKCHYVIRESGKIRALVGIYPGEIVIGDETWCPLPLYCSKLDFS